MIAGVVLTVILMAGPGSDPLIKQLGDPEYKIRSAATSALIEMTPDSELLTIKTGLFVVSTPERSVRSSYICQERLKYHLSKIQEWIDKLTADEMIKKSKEWIDEQIQLDMDGRDLRMTHSFI